MFRTLSERWLKDKDLPDRAHRVGMLTRVLDGTLYDVLPHDFHTEKNPAGEYVPVRERRPSVRYRLCRLVVDDAASLLFGEGHFPQIECDQEAVKDALLAIEKEVRLVDVMTDAVTRGAVGSVAILLRVLKNRPFVTVLPTTYLTPTWDPFAPDTLVKVVERYKVKGKQLVDAGFTVANEAAEYWVQRDWTVDEEVVYEPIEVIDAAKGSTPQRDTSKSTTHNLGFVPIVWIKNLPGGDEIDGAPTIPDEAIDTGIEIDYQLSQAGRGLRYSSDPTLLVKEPVVGEGGDIVKGGGNAIVVSKDGDARMLEINGTAVQAVMEYVRLLRELALESMHGNRANTEKSMAAPSGRALEMLNQALIWLADRLRTSYGEGALLDLLRMILRAHERVPLMLKDGTKLPKIDPKLPLSLRWPPWYAPTLDDMQTRADTLSKLTDSGLMSRETAIRVLADEYDIEDAKAEQTLAEAELAQRNADAQKQVRINE